MRQTRVRTISESVVKHLVAAFDAAALMGAGIAAMHWDSAGVDWRLAGLVVLLGTVLGLNFLHLAGAYRFRKEISVTGADVSEVKKMLGGN